MAAKIKPVLKAWCLPKLPENRLVALHKALVAAVVSVKGLKVKGEQDLVVLFPTDMMQYGLGAEILAEYQHTDDELDDELDTLAAKLGNVLRRDFPKACIQVEVRPGVADYEQHCWNSESVSSRKQVEKIVAAGERRQPKLDHAVEKHCHCEANAADHKGPCGYCNEAGANRRMVQAGKKVLATKDPAEFQVAADVFVQSH